ncbi:proteinase inhibitor I4 serpin [Streptomyces pristinaespiralis]|uniref:proteinase inhibitor I4 serpin n=1 Tax=Streptomyces pristinaespiralis TaxID=38300 RepID=UPI003788C764
MNRLTRRWAGSLPGPGGNVVSATSLWPLLALLQDAAGGPARDELEDATGLPTAEAAGAARGLLEALGAIRGTRSALGLWTRAALPLHAGWKARLPAGTTGSLTGSPAIDRGVLDGWAEERTGGLIRSMPVQIKKDTRLVLAAAQSVRTRWLQPFRETDVVPEDGPWQGRYLLGLHRTTSLLDRLAVAETPDGPVTVLKVLGSTGVDVHLLLGAPDMTPAQVLGHGIGTLAGAGGSPVPLPLVTGDRLPYGEPGPGLRVANVRSRTPQPVLDVLTVAFRAAANHDLLAEPTLFGLSTASDASRGHFPAISPEPLAVGSAGQGAVAVFDAEGFESATVTAISVAAGGMPPPPRYTVRHIEVAFDRPFGFLAVHRTSRLVLTAGWVTEPAPFPEDPEYDAQDERDDHGNHRHDDEPVVRVQPVPDTHPGHGGAPGAPVQGAAGQGTARQAVSP